MITDRGKPTQIVWDQDEKDVQRVPGTKILQGGVLPVPRQGGLLTNVTSQIFPGVPGGFPVLPDPSGFYTAEWFLSPSDGLTVQNVRFVQANVSDEVHKVVEFMQWRNLRLIVDRGPAPFQTIPVTLPDSTCMQGALMTQKGTRTVDNKTFAWGACVMFNPFDLPDKSPAGLLSNIKYTVTVSQSYLFGAPDADIEPSGSVVAVKAWPVMTVSITSSDPKLFPPPSFAADLKLVVAPRLTRPDQHRPAPQFPNSALRDTNVVSIFSDTNDLSRGIPGQPGPFLAPNKPFWDRVFDYSEPDVNTEIAFDAVVFPRSIASTKPFTAASPSSSLLQCQRVGGQGEFDNVHIHPWVGFDDPTSSSGTNSNSPKFIEAPIAADEVIHMHWRWGVGVPQGVKDGSFPTPADAENFRRSFRGFDPQANQPNSLAGAPLIPADQSLRIKLGNPGKDVSDPPAGPLDPNSTVIWYSPMWHAPKNGAYTQFFVHGFACAYRLKPLTLLGGLITAVDNSDLLDSPFPPSFSYHDLRFDSSGNQNVLTASGSAPPGLSRNRIGTGSPPVDKDFFSPK
jgi:hypothetical protein